MLTFEARVGSLQLLTSAAKAVREAGPSRGRFASPQATPLDQEIPVQFLCSPWGGRRHCNSQAFTATDFPRQVPKWDILCETDYIMQ